MEPQKPASGPDNDIEPMPEPPAVSADTPASAAPAPTPTFAGSVVSSSIPEAQSTDASAEPLGPAAQPDVPPPAHVIGPAGQVINPAPVPVVMKTEPLPLKSHKRSKRSLIFAALVAAFVVVLGGGAAASYYYIANKPENILKQALANSFDLKKNKTVQFSGELSAQDPASNLTMGATFKGTGDNQTGAFDISGKFDVLVANVTFDMRSVDSKTLYFKVGGLDGLTGLLSTNEMAAPYAPIFDALNDQWIEVNESLLKQVDSSYVNGVFTEADTQKIRDAYQNHSFFVIKEVMADQVISGDNSYHYKMVVDSTKLRAFLAALKDANLDSYKFKQESLDQLNKAIDMAKLDKYPFEVWISKVTKFVNQVGFKADVQNAAMSFKLTVESRNKPVKVEKPQNTKSLLELMSDFFGGNSPIEFNSQLPNAGLQDGRISL